MTETLTYLTIGLIPGLILLDWAIRGRKHDSMDRTTESSLSQNLFAMPFT